MKIDNCKNKKAFLFDLGGTLIKYYNREEFPEILKQSINHVRDFLSEKYLLKISESEIWKKVKEENRESPDFRVRPMEDRLYRIFNLNLHTHNKISDKLCRLFMSPIFAVSYLFKDSFPTIKELKKKGFKIAVVSNTPWGCPSELWHEELERYGFNPCIDVSVFCRDAGWRKPAKPIFFYTLKKLALTIEDCIFVGDNPRWDLVGPKNIGMDAILIKRNGRDNLKCKNCINNLSELLNLI